MTCPSSTTKGGSCILLACNTSRRRKACCRLAPSRRRTVSSAASGSSRARWKPTGSIATTDILLVSRPSSRGRDPHAHVNYDIAATCQRARFEDHGGLAASVPESDGTAALVLADRDGQRTCPEPIDSYDRADPGACRPDARSMHVRPFRLRHRHRANAHASRSDLTGGRGRPGRRTLGAPVNSDVAAGAGVRRLDDRVRQGAYRGPSGCRSDLGREMSRSIDLAT
jgi:hypothetical protein